ncbi:uncharacterized protein PFL1_00471 [Pseudozyma flocculosa PF-1]|uniref:uncharacterized protein n=1 Tax=Pseudozyma flocculosa PF-1 TaxID=1277687 RepID=UPI0004560796|nr:uncharacterized protein PFL1_00471 [Pseudozyma flocculosa PF-1]EPQ32274.1 hypothetical protein PFL1_00471 [Pseudozyma flocculosa PF-1]
MRSAHRDSTDLPSTGAVAPRAEPVGPCVTYVRCWTALLAVSSVTYGHGWTAATELGSEGPSHGQPDGRRHPPGEQPSLPVGEAGISRPIVGAKLLEAAPRLARCLPSLGPSRRRCVYMWDDGMSCMHARTKSSEDDVRKLRPLEALSAPQHRPFSLPSFFRFDDVRLASISDETPLCASLKCAVEELLVTRIEGRDAHRVVHQATLGEVGWPEEVACSERGGLGKAQPWPYAFGHRVGSGLWR